MRTQEIRALTDQQLYEALLNNQKELMNLRFRKAARQLEKPTEIVRVRRDIARLKTILRERNLRES